MTRRRRGPPPLPRPQLHLPAWLLVGESHLAAFRFVAANLVPLAMLLVLSFGVGQMRLAYPGGGIVDAAMRQLIDLAVSLLCLLTAGIGTFVWLMEGERMPLFPFRTLWEPRALVFTLRTLSLGVATLALMLGAMVFGGTIGMIVVAGDPGVPLALNRLSAGQSVDWQRYGPALNTIFALMGLWLIPAVLVSFRLSLAMPAALSSRPLGMIALWKLTRGHGRTVMWVTTVALLPTLALLGLLGTALAYSDGLLHGVLLVLFQLDLMLHGVVNSAVIFMIWRALPGHAALVPASPVPPLPAPSSPERGR